MKLFIFLLLLTTSALAQYNFRLIGCGACPCGKVESPDGLSCVYVNATGGSVSVQGNYKVHTFYSAGSFSFTSGKTTGFEVLVVGGGGGGGTSMAYHGGAGGGGAGGVRHITNQTIPNGNHSITIGYGGNPGQTQGCTPGQSGGDSSIGSVVSASGGGGGGVGCNPTSYAWSGKPGGSGGGAGFMDYANGASGGSGESGQGNWGGNSTATIYGGPGAGGGGAGSAGLTPTVNVGGAGGSGTNKNITGANTTYAVGGRGGNGHTPLSGSSYTGDGGDGGAGGLGPFYGGSGGSGIVVIKYLYQ